MPIPTILNENKNITIVYSKGKTGTTTIYNSLLQFRNSLYQIHTLNKKTINKRVKKFNELKSSYPSSIIGSKYLVKRLENYKTIDIVTVVRDPVSIEISSYFQNKDKYNFKFNSQDELINYLRNSDFEDGSWFDNEIKEVFNIDIFAETFDKKQDFTIITKDNIRILVLKLEKLNEVGDLALSKFFDQKIELVNSNLAKEKNYMEEYSSVKNKLTIPHEILDSVYDSKYVRHFYTDNEIEKLKKKWVN